MEEVGEDCHEWSHPPSYLKWTERDALRHLEVESISIKEITLYQMKEWHKKEIFAIFESLLKEEIKKAFIKKVVVNCRGVGFGGHHILCSKELLIYPLL